MKSSILQDTGNLSRTEGSSLIREFTRIAQIIGIVMEIK